MRRGLFLALGLGLATIAEAGAQEAKDPRAVLTAASARIAAAGQALAAAQANGTVDATALATAIDAYQEALAALRAGVRDATGEEQALTVALEARREEVSRLLAALEMMSRTPPPAQGLHPDGPIGAARAGAMMSELTPALADEALEIAGTLRSIASARALVDSGTADLANGLTSLNEAQARLSAVVAASAPDPDEPLVTADLAQMARDSLTLSQLAADLAGAEGVSAPVSASAPGPALWPVEGEVVSGFNAPDGAGVRRPGLVVRAAPLSPVRAPVAGMVRYAGPFLEYGYVVVIADSEERMFILAGLAQLNVRTGAPVDRGDLIGLLGGRALDVEEYVMLPQADTGAGVSETLYIEVRQGRVSVDPEPMFADGKG